MKGARNAPDKSGRIRLASAKRKGSIKRQGFKRPSRHEGLAPVRLPRLETGSGSFADELLPDIGSIGLSFILGSAGLWPVDAGFPFRATRLRGRRVGRKWRPSVRGLKTAPAFRLPHETGGPETKTEETHEPMRRASPALAPLRPEAASMHARPQPPSRREGPGATISKKGPGGRRKCLKRPDSAKESKAFSLLNFGRALLDRGPGFGSIWVWLAVSPGDRRAPDVPWTAGLRPSTKSAACRRLNEPQG